MGKFDDQLSRMEYLMNFRTSTNESRSNVEYSAEGADGKYYGIIKEGSKFYIKVCKDNERKHLAESYAYINGITAKKENEYKSYNEASKQLEFKLMSLNEAYNGNKRTSTVDFKRDEKTFNMLTEEARKELDRMHTILENSMTIGMNNTGNPEAPKTATFSPSIGGPFEEKAEAKLDKDLKVTASNPEKQGEPFDKEEKVTDADMESDKAPKGCDSCKDMKDAEYVPEDAVAAKKPSGGKVVKVNESEEEMVNVDDENIIEEDDMVGFDDELTDDGIESLLSDDGTFYGEEPYGDDEFEYEMGEEPEMLDGEGVTPAEDDLEMGSEDELGDDEMPMESKNTLKSIVESVCDDVMAHIAFNKYLGNIIKEEVTKLNVFGKHPGYRKKPMTVPANKEVVKTNGDKDWNDDSAKGEQPFGQKIGSSAPFDKQVKVLTDAVMKAISENLKKK